MNWINIDDKKPEEDQKVLAIILEDQDICVMTYVESDVFYHQSEGWSAICIYWMPLPEKP